MDKNIKTNVIIIKWHYKTIIIFYNYKITIKTIIIFLTKGHVLKSKIGHI